LVECYYNRDLSLGELQLATLERAVEVCRYYRSAFAVVREKTADSDSISSILLKVWDLATINPDGVTPRELYRGIKAIGRRAQQVGQSVGAYTLELITKLVQMGKGTLEKNGRSLRFFAKSVDEKPTERTEQKEIENKKSLPACSLVTTTNERDSNSNYSKSVTEVTDAQNNQLQELEPSSISDVSPVTTEYNQSPTRYQNEIIEPNNTKSANASELKQIEMSEFSSDESSSDKSSLEHKHNLNWSLQFLADLESNPAPNRRFSSLEQLENLFDELEQRAKDCYDELLKKCPAYWERIIIAQKKVSECLTPFSL
jgi:hypothetical protein